MTQAMPAPAAVKAADRSAAVGAPLPAWQCLALWIAISAALWIGLFMVGGKLLAQFD